MPIHPTPLRTPLPPAQAGAPITLPATPVALPATSPSYAPPPRDWFVYQPDGRHIGPLSTDSLARAWLANRVPRDAFVGAAGETQWWPLGAAAEIMEAARALETRSL